MVSVFILAALRHYHGALSAPQQVVLVRSFLTLPRGSGERQARLGVELLRLLDESEDRKRWGEFGDPNPSAGGAQFVVTQLSGQFFDYFQRFNAKPP